MTFQEIQNNMFLKFLLITVNTFIHWNFISQTKSRKSFFKGLNRWSDRIVSVFHEFRFCCKLSHIFSFFDFIINWRFIEFQSHILKPNKEDWHFRVGWDCLDLPLETAALILWTSVNGSLAKSKHMQCSSPLSVILKTYWCFCMVEPIHF